MFIDVKLPTFITFQTPLKKYGAFLIYVMCIFYTPVKKYEALFLLTSKKKSPK